ncbi:Cys-Gln thioester bond-forming surface protein [Corynebacterium hindlerae]|uniref:Cys-Gln thioester bond-forming surface protein n=1 Tax=Corynebacterium hindlerae TaxID=699041 RepID=A0A7G5FD37_9CORY|nr:thioester domain-containing protein [Corynebacterium hindlerae]QMV84528.1 Cys-Gln thioester bond-forming surface protein [Corynebacterium hindlerae]
MFVSLSGANAAEPRIDDGVKVSSGKQGYEIVSEDGKSRETQLFKLVSESFNGQSYCVEADVRIDVSASVDGKFTSWSNFAGNNQFVKYADKVNWIVENSYPAVSLESLANTIGAKSGELNEKSAIAQTQAAIWRFTDGYSLKEIKFTNARQELSALQEGQKKLYDYLVGEKNIGSKRVDIVQVNEEKVVEKDGVVGPFQFQITGGASEFSVKLGAGQSLVDKDGNTVRSGEEFYVKVDQNVSSVKFDLEVPNAGVGGAIVHAVKDNVRQQTTIVTYSEQKTPLTRTVEWTKKEESVANHDIEISKVDLNGTELPGAQITVLKKSDGSKVDSWVSTDKPHRISVAPGEYVFKETAAPKGYKVVSDITFTVNAKGEVSTSDVQQTVNSVKVAVAEKNQLTVINEAEQAPLTKVLLSKVALGQKDELAGAKMTLSKVGIAWDEPVTALIEEWTSGNKPREFSAEPGVYQLTEVTAPQGYEVAESIIFHVAGDGKVQVGVKDSDGHYKLEDAEDNKVVMVDKPSPTTTPSTSVTTSEPTPSETTVTVTTEVPVTVTSTTEVPTTVTTTVETPVPTTVTETTVVPTTVVTTETTTTEVVVPTTVETTTTEMAAPTTTTTTVQAASGFDLRYVLGALGLWALLKEGGSSSSDMGSSSSSTKAPIVVPAPSVPNRQDRVDSISNEPPVAQKGVQPQQTPAKKMLASTGANVVGLSAVAALLLALGLYFVAKRRKES